MVRARKRAVSNRFLLFLFGQFHLECHPCDSASSCPPQGVPLATRKLESLLAYLALHPGPQLREKLATIYWGDAPELHARNSLRNALSSLRSKLGPSLLIVDRECAGINPHFPLWVDALVFKAQCQRFLAAPSPDLHAVDLDLYRGDLLEVFDDEWIELERAEWGRLFVSTGLGLIQAARTQGDYARAIELAQIVLARDPGNERAHQHLMFAYLVTGNRQSALSQYETCRRTLQTELDVEPMPETTALYDWIKQSSGHVNPLTSRLTNLPIPVSSFIGRQNEIRQLKNLISSSRLVTITGAGGSGKTRLAIHTATDLLDTFKDGVHWIEFGSIEDPLLVPQAIARALGIRESASEDIGAKLERIIADRHVLLILDNCEHLLGTCAAIAARLLNGCSQLQVLATSRERLGISGEIAWLVPLLSIPDERQEPASLKENDAVQLFAARARAVKADFLLTERNAYLVAQICKRLDGIPLAIELAAARTAVLSLSEISSRLDNRFSLLTTGSRTALPRQQTLRALIDWSYDLLSPGERTLLRQSAVFVGGQTVAAVQAVCGGDGISPGAIVDLLCSLVAKSLMYVEEIDGETRYRLLDTIQQYACEKLDACGAGASMRARHLAYFLKFTEAAEPQLQGPEQVSWLNRLEQEYGNLRSALEWSLGAGEQPKQGLELAGNLYWFWVVRGPLSEGRRWLEKAVAQDSSAGRSAARAKALNGIGEIAWNQNDLSVAGTAFRAALEIWSELNDSWNCAFGVLSIAWVLFNEGKLDQAGYQFEQAVTLARATGDKSLTARALRGLGNSVMQTDPAAARPLLEEGADLFRQVGDQLRLAHTLNALANIALLERDYQRTVSVASESVRILHEAVDRVSLPSPLGSLGQGYLGQGKLDKAHETFLEGLELAQENGDQLVLAKHLTGFGGIFLARGQLVRAVQLFAAAESLLIAVDLPIITLHRYNVALMHHLQELRAMLPEPEFSTAWAEGCAMTADQAIALALNA